MTRLAHPVAWSGRRSPGLFVWRAASRTGSARDFHIETTLGIVRAPGAIPIEGSVNARYDQRAATLEFGDSTLNTPATRIHFSGTLGESMRANLDTGDLTDLLPGLAMLSADAPKELPIKLAGGRAAAGVTISGKLSNPVIAGHMAIGRFETGGHTFDHLAADVNVSAGELAAKTSFWRRAASR